MPNYAKLHQLVSHRVSMEYDTGARVVGYLATCLPGDEGKPVQFAKLTSVELRDNEGNLIEELEELLVCPNILTGFHKDEGPRGRDL